MIGFATGSCLFSGVGEPMATLSPVTVPARRCFQLFQGLSRPTIDAVREECVRAEDEPPALVPLGGVLDLLTPPPLPRPRPRPPATFAAARPFFNFVLSGLSAQPSSSVESLMTLASHQVDFPLLVELVRLFELVNNIWHAGQLVVHQLLWFDILTKGIDCQRKSVRGVPCSQYATSGQNNVHKIARSRRLQDALVIWELGGPRGAKLEQHIRKLFSIESEKADAAHLDVLCRYLDHSFQCDDGYKGTFMLKGKHHGLLSHHLLLPKLH